MIAPFPSKRRGKRSPIMNSHHPSVGIHHRLLGFRQRLLRTRFPGAKTRFHLLLCRVTSTHRRDWRPLPRSYQYKSQIILVSLGRLNGNAVPAGNSYKMRPQCYIYRLLTHYYYHLLTMGRRFPVARCLVLLAIFMQRNNEEKCAHKETIASEGLQALAALSCSSTNRCLLRRRINGLLGFLSGFITIALRSAKRLGCHYPQIRFFFIIPIQFKFS